MSASAKCEKVESGFVLQTCSFRFACLLDLTE